MAYRRLLDKDTQGEEIRLINQALEITKNSKAKPFQIREAWKKFWRTNMEEMIDIKSDDTTFSAPGGDGNR